MVEISNVIAWTQKMALKFKGLERKVAVKNNLFQITIHTLCNRDLDKLNLNRCLHFKLEPIFPTSKIQIALKVVKNDLEFT